MLRLLVIFALIAMAFPAFADPFQYKDSIDYTLDDGVMSHEEMEQEAAQMHQLCTLNPYQKLYFNCDCVAGAFLQQREKLGPVASQEDIWEGINNGSTALCGNTEAIAGQTYKNCMEYRVSFYELSRDNESVCTCMANRVARNFSDRPFLGTNYVARLNYEATSYCDNPANRRSTSASNTKP